MATRFDICAPRKGKDDKTFWHRIGTAWQGDKGIQLVFDSLPIPDIEGRCVANLFEPREQGDRARSASNDRQQAQQRSQSTADDLDDDLPPF